MGTPEKIIAKVLLILLVAFWLTWGLAHIAEARYRVEVPSDVYTIQYDPNDLVYKFLSQPPLNWTEQFGDNERTAIIHAISELRVVVVEQGRRLLALEKFNKDSFDIAAWDPNQGPFFEFIPPLAEPNVESNMR